MKSDDIIDNILDNFKIYVYLIFIGIGLYLSIRIIIRIIDHVISNEFVGLVPHVVAITVITLIIVLLGWKLNIDLKKKRKNK